MLVSYAGLDWSLRIYRIIDIDCFVNRGAICCLKVLKEAFVIVLFIRTIFNNTRRSQGNTCFKVQYSRGWSLRAKWITPLLTMRWVSLIVSFRLHDPSLWWIILSKLRWGLRPYSVAFFLHSLWFPGPLSLINLGTIKAKTGCNSTVCPNKLNSKTALLWQLHFCHESTLNTVGFCWYYLWCVRMWLAVCYAYGCRDVATYP